MLWAKTPNVQAILGQLIHGYMLYNVLYSFIYSPSVIPL